MAGDIAGNRLAPAQYAENFSDLHHPLTRHEALVESDRCYFCHDAPCMTACPTTINIPLFIRQIQTGQPKNAAKTIFDQNILGGMCARVCPTETLCEEVCVRQVAEGKPVKIGLLQRHATDALMAEASHPYQRSEPTGKKIAVVGGGPAGLACAHRLAMLGHGVTIFEAREKAGGLNEYGIAAYKTVDDFAAREVAFVLSIGGIEMKRGALPKLGDLQRAYDAVFIGVGLRGVNALGLAGEDAAGMEDAVDYIAELRQADDLAELLVGRRVLVIGGGMTAIDIAIQSKLLGADNVTILYRRGPADMKASTYEQELAQTNGVEIKHFRSPMKILLDGNAVSGLQCLDTRTQETIALPADMIFKAIGQTAIDVADGALQLSSGRIVVDDEKRTSVEGIWAGGDCAAGGQDLTVAAVDDGRRAAHSIHAHVMRSIDAHVMR